MLTSYRWPGNVRELVNTLERTIAVARNEPVLFPKHLSMQIRIEVTRQSLKKEEAGSSLCQPTFESLPQLSDYRDAIYMQAEHKYLHDLIQSVDFNIQKACEISGLSTSRLYALLKKQGISLQH